MDRNLLLAFAMSFLVLSLWSMYQAPPPPGPSDAPAEYSEEVTTLDSAPPAGSERFAELPEGEAPPSLPPREASPRMRGDLAGERQSPEAERMAEQIEAELPHFRASLTTLGAALTGWELSDYDVRVGRGREPVRLIEDVGLGPAAATPFIELERGNLARAVWRLVDASNTEATFEIERDGVRIEKRYVFDPDSYGFRLTLELENNSTEVVTPRFMVDWPARQGVGSDYEGQAFAVLEDGEVDSQPILGLGSAGFFGSLTGSRPKPYFDYEGDIDWAGVQTPYFLAALLPDDPGQASARIAVLEPSESGTVQVFFDGVQIPPGQRAIRELRGYLGPKEVERLEALGSGAVQSIDLGWSWVAPLTRLFAWLLHALYTIIPNYGVAIILLTILVRVVTTPLTVKQMRSMERMRRLQPQLKEIQEKYADDRQKQSEAMMALYRREKVNPLGGCLPMILQLPVFIGLFYALRSSIHLRQAPFFGWIDDLSAPEELFVIPGIGIPFRVLPLIMGATMLVQQRLTPMQMDPAQAKMMMTIMPIMMTVLFYQFPSGLVLYWMMSNILAIAHQLWVGRNIQPAASASTGSQAAKSTT